MNEQMDLMAGLQAKSEGQNLVEDHNPNFVAIMRSHAILTATSKGQVTCDDLREYASAQGLRPKHQNAWGSIFRGPDWKMIGRTKSKLVSNHAREIRIWRYEHV